MSFTKDDNVMESLENTLGAIWVDLRAISRKSNMGTEWSLPILVDLRI